MAASTQTAAGRVVQYIKAAAKGNDKEGMTSVGDQIDKYNKMHDHHGGDATERKKEYADLVNSYYNLATDFYEIGWGQSFHFANRLAGVRPPSTQAPAAPAAPADDLPPPRPPLCRLLLPPARGQRGRALCARAFAARADSASTLCRTRRRVARFVDCAARVLPRLPAGDPADGHRARLWLRHRRPASQPRPLHRRLDHRSDAQPVPS